MADRKKVLQNLVDIYDEAYDRWVHRQYIEDKLVTLIRDVFPDVFALLRKQDPVEPVNIRWEMNIRGGTCPKCLNWVQRSYNYCPFCGKEVKWND